MNIIASPEPPSAASSAATNRNEPDSVLMGHLRLLAAVMHQPLPVVVEKFKQKQLSNLSPGHPQIGLH